MNFVQWEFLAFFVLVFGVYWSLPGRRLQNLLLVGCSAIFYGWVHPWFLLLLYGSAVLDYNMGRLMVSRPGRRRLWLTLSLCGNLGMLGYFKYANFFIDNVVAVATSMGATTDLSTLDIFLPVGISFYTFQTMSYTLDIYRGKLTPRQNFLDYIVFISFFPQLVAGPVERAATLLPQMEADRRFDWQQLQSGLALALWGAFKKVCLADTVAPYVDRVFALEDPSSAMIWAATLGFTLQIYADFSGYTDIARGTARMLGFELMENFKHPYIARSPADFWRRWHISFSTWIRDYLYIPLGGSRGSWWETQRATLGAMLLSGLWHGASWTFVLWGGYHAALLTGYRIVGPRIPASIRESAAGRRAAVVLMFAFTVFGWLIFRETDIGRLGHYLALPPLAGTPDQWLTAAVVTALTLVCWIPLVIELLAKTYLAPRLEQTPWRLPIRTTLWAVLALAIFVLARGTTNDFIYFQF